MKRKISIVASYYGHKLGVGVFLERLLPLLLEKLLRENYQVTLIVSDDFYNNSVHLLPVNENVEIIRPVLLKNNILSKFYFLFIFPFLSYVRKSKYVLYTSDAIIGQSVKNGIPIIHDLNDFEVENKFGFFRSFFRKKMIKLSLIRACKVITISKFVKAQIQSVFPKEFEIKFIKVIYNGIMSSSEFKEADDSESVHSKVLYFLVVGRLDPYAKKLYEAVALYETYKKSNASVKLKIVGGINDYCKDDAHAFLEYIEKDRDIEYLGFVSDEELDVLYKYALATLFLSQYEGFGFPLLESFSRGCPVITNGDNKVNNELASGRDIKILESELIDESIVNEKVSQIYKIDKKDLMQIASEFTWERAADEYYEELMK